MNKQTSARVSTAAARLMNERRRGGPIQVHRVALLASMEHAISHPKHYPIAVTDDERRLDAIETLLMPFFDAVESVAASAMGQDETKGQAGGR